MHGQTYECAALVTTKDRWDYLTHRALPSIRNQLLLPKKVILVNDGNNIQEACQTKLIELMDGVPIEIIPNARKPGLAGALNTGLDHLINHDYDGYIAILDDDDEWDKEHILYNLAKAQETEADLVVSGLRRVAYGQVKPRALPTNLKESDFLCGNPGLQGSNTFVNLRALERAGKFTNGLPSLNDRDLAIRLLRMSVKIAYTEQWTATWHHDHGRKTLSSPRSKEKIIGLQWFWQKYNREMSSDEQNAYFERSLKYFSVTQEEILDNWGIDAIG